MLQETSGVESPLAVLVFLEPLHSGCHDGAGVMEKHMGLDRLFFDLAVGVGA